MPGFHRLLAAAAVCLVPIISGCGTVVPQIQEITQTEEEGKSLVRNIIANITCEVQESVLALYVYRPSTFMDEWGVQINLLLTIEEKTTLSPNVGWFPNNIFSLGAGVSAGGVATRVDKINSYFTIQELRNRVACDPRLRPGGPMLMASDLKLTQWLSNAVTAGETGAIRFQNSDAFKASGVLSHEVRFLVTTTGTLNPAWVLSRVVSVNPTGPLFSTSRDRTHDLIVTFGPTEDGVRPAPTAANSALASEIGASFFTNVRNAIVSP